MALLTIDPTRIVGLGSAPVRGTQWHEDATLDVDDQGVMGDRQWTLVTPELACVRMTAAPHLTALRIETHDLPAEGGERVDVAYYDRMFPATLHDGPVAAKASRLIGRPVRLAHTTRRPGFIWGSPVSVLFTSELTGLPHDWARYRANVVVDDDDAPVRPALGDRLALGEVTLEVEGEIDRCLVIDHHPATGVRDQRLLGRLRPGVLLAYGARVVNGGRLAVSAP